MTTLPRLLILSGAAALTLLVAAPASALTQAECSTKYNAAKDAGTLNGMTWNQFRKAECAADATAAEPAKPAKKAAADKKSAKSSDKAATDTTAAGGGLSMKDCSAKYQAAKEAGTLGGQKWNDFRKTECAAGATAAAPAKQTKTEKAAAKTAAPATGLSMKECSTKYQAAKEAGTLGGQKWNDFRKSNCGAGAADDDTVPAQTEAQYTSEPEKPTSTAPRSVKFPASVSAKYSKEPEGQARMHTCLDQYYANKDSNALGGLKWIQKGGGYYSLCNAKLKG